MAASVATLTACAGGPSKPLDLTAAQPDPVVETRTRTRVVCPDELKTAPASLPAAPADAEVTWNDPAREWFDQVIDVAQAAVDAVRGARQACEAAGAQ